MSKVKHTPGPWKASEFVSEVDGWTEVTIRKDDHEEECLAIVERGEDAYLIAAAPDMLEALKNIENDDNHIPSTIWAMVKDAIAKAEGRE